VKRIGIIIVAFNAASTLAKVLDRIPRDFLPRITEILICDNASEDQTYLVGLGYKQVVGKDLPLNIIRNDSNLGYGGNQKVGYTWAIEHDLDIVVLLHADGQYAPELLPEIVAPLERGEADAVFGSRMMTPGGARKGGMPLYKVVGNKVLSTIENKMVGTNLSEWHTGYRAYSTAALRDVPFLRNSDDYDFDTEIIVQFHEAGKRIVEIPIPTYYGDEISYVNGIRYAKDIVIDVVRYRAHKMGIGDGGRAFASSPFEPKTGPDTATGRMLAWLRGRPPSRVLLLGGTSAVLAPDLRAAGHDVVAVHAAEVEPVVELDGSIVADLDAGIPAAAGDGFDVAILVDSLGQVRDPAALLRATRGVLADGGTVLASFPNFGHWYPRAKVIAGRWRYDKRGILDAHTLRFFSSRTIPVLLADAGFRAERQEVVGLPMGAEEERPKAVAVVDGVGLALRPSLFAYQYVYELVPEDSAA
jgi:glycosyltransferase involved in cell wall biosynthesis